MEVVFGRKTIHDLDHTNNAEETKIDIVFPIIIEHVYYLLCHNLIGITIRRAVTTGKMVTIMLVFI